MAGVRPEKLTVSSIKSRLLNVAQSSLYRVTLAVPQAVRDTLSLSSFDYDNIDLLCSEASLPGSSLTTHEVNNDYHGVTEKMAYRRLYDETIGLTFYVDRNYKVIEMIEGWMNYITGIDDSKRYENPYVSYRVAYPKTYKNNIYLTKFERDHFSTVSEIPRTTLDYTFVNAFPLSLTATPVSYEGSEVLKCSASFNFIRYVKKIKQISSISAIEGQRSTIDSLINVNPFVAS